MAEMEEKAKKMSGFLNTQAIPVGRKKRNPKYLGKGVSWGCD